jgi:hypothetical protein
MALSERSRVVLHTKLTQVVGDEEAVSDMLSEFPASDLERPATKEFVRAEITQLETRLKDFVHEEMKGTVRWLVGVFMVSQTAMITAIALFA